ncbi:MAG: hypothetical protein IJ128_08515 [Firmicutes bacterium]|nr:hypothetical protein [Bacillota bacterium]
MAYNILLTSLYAAGKNEELRYFYSKDGYRNYYCDAMLTVEASTKYALSKYPVDEIITLGRKLTFDEGDDDRLIQLSAGSNFYAAEMEELSTYSLYRYRIAQFLDELRIEQQDLMDLLDIEEQKEVTRFIRQFAQGKDQDGNHRKFNRLFDELAQEPGAFDDFMDELREAIPEAAGRRSTYTDWVKNYLFAQLKDSAKLELLPENEDVLVRFIPTSLLEDGKLPIDNMLQIVHSIINEHDDDINLYVALNSDDLTDNFVLLNILDIIEVMPESRVTVRDILTTSDARDELAGEVSDDAEFLGVSELVAATRTFLKYGKVDMIVDFWERSGVHNERIESMIYAMRSIDIGISLCLIKEIESGITALRDIFASGTDMGGKDYYSRLYSLIAEAIVRVYGSLLQGNEIRFIDLVKWAAGKKFYQQTLTLIESRAPRDFVSKGIFFYCDDEEKAEHVTELFAEFRNTLKPFEYYMMDDLDHYFVKIYDRRVHRRKGNDQQRSYAAYRTAQLDNKDPARCTAYTVCEDRQRL